MTTKTSLLLVVCSALLGCGTPADEPHIGTSQLALFEATWSASPADQPDAEFGKALDSAGDVNADGYADLIVGAAGWSDVLLAPVGLVIGPVGALLVLARAERAAGVVRRRCGGAAAGGERPVRVGRPARPRSPERVTSS